MMLSWRLLLKSKAKILTKFNLKKIPGQSFATLPDYLVPKQVRQIGSVNKGKRDMKRRNLWKKNKSDVIKAKRERKKEDPLSAVKVEKASKKWIISLDLRECE